MAKRALVALLAATAACGRTGEAQAQNTRAQERVQQQLGNPSTVVDTALAARLSATFRAAASRALPAVVQIRVQSQPQVAQQGRGFPGMPPGMFGFPAPNPGPEQGTGSGFIFDPRGYIMTNNHVVENATQIVVQMVDGREFTAKVVGADPNTDVAVIQITPPSGEKLPVAAMGNSDQLQVGDWILALGNPLTLTFTVTAGIVSAKGRNIGILAANNPNPEEGGGLNPTLEAYIQTDAAINPGNSGGPMVDLLGRVVGINSAIESPTGVFAGVGFAIPINLARRVAEDLVRYGVVHRPRIGVTIATVTAADAQVYGLSSVQGALITSVETGTPAADAGLRVGDVVLDVNGKPVNSATELQTTLTSFEPGQTVNLTIWRERKQQTVSVKLGQFEAPKTQATTTPTRTSASQRLGIEVAPLTPAIAQQLGINRTTGVVISGVPELSPAATLVRRGEVILSVNGQAVNSVADLEKIAAGIQPGDVVSLRLLDPTIGETVANFTVRR